ncbi:DUF2683 family protein [Candidatus Woesearchaeota archaeon]|nr:DUF2683 family protein [Candidatus Woesearchaeota archaeon]
MVKIQIDLSNEEDNIVEMYKIKSGFATKELAIKKMIQKFSDCKHKFKLYKEVDISDLLTKHMGRKTIKVIQKCEECGDFREDIVKA